MMSVDEFRAALANVKSRKNDKEWFPKWIRRYGETAACKNGKLVVTPESVIAFCKILLRSKTPAWQRLQAVRALETYRSLVLGSDQPPLDHIRLQLAQLASKEKNIARLGDNAVTHEQPARGFAVGVNRQPILRIRPLA